MIYRVVDRDHVESPYLKRKGSGVQWTPDFREAEVFDSYYLAAQAIIGFPDSVIIIKGHYELSDLYVRLASLERRVNKLEKK